MGQVLRGSATTTEAVRRAIQHSQESVRALAERHGVNPKTVSKWKHRETVADRKTGPKEARSTVLTPEEEAVVVASRRYTLLPLDDCLYGLQPTIPHLTRSSLHRCFQRHGIKRLPEVEGNKAPKKKFKAYPIGYFHIDIAEVRTAEGKLHLFVAIGPASLPMSSFSGRRQQSSQSSSRTISLQRFPTPSTLFSLTIAFSSLTPEARAGRLPTSGRCGQKENCSGAMPLRVDAPLTTLITG
jgi:hypothetical protein